MPNAKQKEAGHRVLVSHFCFIFSSFGFLHEPQGGWMPLVVQCFQCQNLLELDDGFRGAICRCSHCGALLEVPAGESQKTQRARPASPNSIKTRKSSSGSSVDIGMSSGIADPRRYRTATSVKAHGEHEKEVSSPLESSAASVPPPVSRSSDRLFLIGIFSVIIITLIIAAIVFYVLVLSAGSQGYSHLLMNVFDVA